VVKINVAERVATVIVQPAWLEHPAENAPALAGVLRGLKVEMAVLTLPDSRAVGTLNAISGKIVAVKIPKKEAPLPPPKVAPPPPAPQETTAQKPHQP
jgi:hypothetical protein